jgi:hypothetical protein
MGAGYIFYVIITAEGKPRRTKQGGSFMIYDDLSVAKGKCRDGDSVSEMTWDSSRNPLFIKGKVLE